MTESTKHNSFEHLHFEQILEKELDYFSGKKPDDKAETSDTNNECGTEYSQKIVKRAHKTRLTGLAFSGGGIRSATFNLGVLQALARMDLIRHFDYLSTVSGGGYIGSWFAAWVQRTNKLNKNKEAKKSINCLEDANTGLNKVTHELTSSVSAVEDDKARAAMQPDPPPIWHLREYSNYLSPRTGLWSTDQWTLGITYIRNFLLTLSLLLTTLITLVLVARIFTTFYFRSAAAWGDYEVAYRYVPIVFCLSIFMAALLAGIELSGNTKKNTSKLWVSNLAVIFTMFAAVTGSLWLWHVYASPPEGYITNLLRLIPWELKLDPSELDSKSGVFKVGAILTGASVISGWFLGMFIGRFNCNEDLFSGCSNWKDGKVKCLLNFVKSVYTGSYGLIKEVFTGILKVTLDMVTGLKKWILSIVAGLFKPGRLARLRSAFLSFINHRSLWLFIGAPLICMAVFLVLLAVLGQWMGHWIDAGDLIYLTPWNQKHWNVVVWGAPLMVLVFSLVALVLVGITGDALRELDREWLGRFFAVLSKWTALTTSLIVLVVYSPILVQWLGEYVDGMLNLGITAMWGTLSTAGAYLARNIIIGKSSTQGWVNKIILSTAPYVFILGMIILTVWLTDVGLVRVHSLLSDHNEHIHEDNYWYLIAHMDMTLLFKTLLCSLLFVFFWSWRVGVNRFSLHSMYADRLIRAYLGASNLNRQAHPFTGFDESDNELRMHDLMCPRATSSKQDEGDRRERQCTEPYLIINAAINLVDSKRLAWQKRKAASFTFTPQYCGYEFCGENDNKPGKENIGRVGGFVGSEHYAGDTHGISLGKAMTISGAAASPNMGYHSSPALTFLMTTFNVRLGWWLPNTTKENSMRISSGAPGWGLLYLWNELLGKTDSKSDYVYLSDGGHFENLGIYELVRRRCYIIVACDAEADPDMTFSGLGNALEKCQIDLGVPIDIDVSQIKRDSETGKSQWHCAVGCIRYSEADKDQPDGILVYIKSSLTGDEPLSVETYANSHKDFPHESTVDQWFDETQFESYRALGEHIATAVLENAVDIARSEETNLKDRIDRVVMELHKQWYAGSDPYSQKPEDHDEQLESIMDTLRTDKHLVFLDGQLYPNLQIVAKEHFDKKDPGKRSTDPVEDTEDDSIADTVDKSRGLLPADYEEFRAGFYFCKRLIQFMQQIYYDRHLDLEYAAPRNRGWMNLFRRWSWSQMLRFTWTMTAGTYGARFQSFCEYRLGLDSGDLEFKDEPFDIVIPCGSRPGQQSGNQSVQYDVRFLHLSDDDDAEEIDWKKAQSEYNFHHYETLLIREFINAYIKHEDVAAIDKLRKNQDPFVFHVYPLKVKTNDPVVDDTNQDINLNFGFIITGPAYFKSGKKNIPGTYGDAVLYFRIRPSMRNMDLARKVIKECGNHEMLKKWHLINLTISKNERRCKAYPDVYSMDKESLCYCRWLSRLREESADEEQHVSK